MVNCHGLSVDKDENIILTYQNNGKDPHCIISWKPDVSSVLYLTRTLSSPVPPRMLFRSRRHESSTKSIIYQLAKSYIT